MAQIAAAEGQQRGKAAVAGPECGQPQHHVARLLAEKGWRVGNVDATIVAQQPKLAPFIGQMNENLARVLGTSLDQVNVKATTEERLGFTGTEQGISAYAVAGLEAK